MVNGNITMHYKFSGDVDPVHLMSEIHESVIQSMSGEDVEITIINANTFVDNKEE